MPSTVAASVVGGELRVVAGSFRHPVVSGHDQKVGSHGKVVHWDGERGRVQVHGEMWQARAAGPLAAGQMVRITALDGLILEVEPDDTSGE
jgi:membrane-bound serine protease (ClpP class)